MRNYTKKQRKREEQGEYNNKQAARYIIFLPEVLLYFLENSVLSVGQKKNKTHNIT